MYDRIFIYRIKKTKVDSLFDAKDYKQVIIELDTFLIRVENIGENYKWSISELYVILGTSYRLSGDTSSAISVWRRGIDIEEQEFIYADWYLNNIAESLQVYDSTFTADSLAALKANMKTSRMIDPTLSILKLVIEILCNLALWFIIGAIIGLVIVAKKIHPDTSINTSILSEIKSGRVAVKFMLYIIIPSVLLPIGITLIPDRATYNAVMFFIASFSGGIVGILLAVFDSFKHSRKYSVPLSLMLRKSFVPLWLSLTVLLAVGFVLIILIVGFVMLVTFIFRGNI